MRIRELQSFFKKVCNFSILIARKDGKGRQKTPSKTMNIRKCLPAVAGFFIAATAFAARHDLPTPGPSEYVDAESSVNVPLPTNEGRHIRLTLAFDPSPTNAVQVAFGRDVNADGDLAPEETALRVGYDCGELQVKVEGAPEVKVRGEGEQWNFSTCAFGLEKEGDILCSPSPITFTLKQPTAVSSRWDLAKVTTHNIADTNVTITAKFYNTGFRLILR